MARVGLGRSIVEDSFAYQDGALSRAIRELEDRVTEILHPVSISDGPYDARLGDMILVDTTAGAIQIRLPVISGADLGRRIVIKRLRGGNNVNVYPADGAKVNDTYVSTVLLTDNSILELIAFERGQWISTAASGSQEDASGETPIFEWNGTDLSQFGSIQPGWAVAASGSASAAVVSSAGVNWIEITNTVGASSGGFHINQSSVLPVGADLSTPDFRIEFEWAISQTAGSSYILGLCLGWESNPSPLGGFYGLTIGKNGSGNTRSYMFETSKSPVSGAPTVVSSNYRRDNNWSMDGLVTPATNWHGRISGRTSGSRIVTASPNYGREYGLRDTSNNFSAARFALFSGNRGVTGTTKNLFRNIKVWAV